MGVTILTAGNVLLLCVLIIAMITDIRSHRIPNWLTLPAMITGLGLNVISAGAGGFLFGVAGIILGIGLFIILYALGGMGAGDVKLMGVVGAYLGPQMVLWAAFYTALFGGIYAFGLILFHPKLREKRRAIKETFKNFVLFRTFNYNKPEKEQNAPKLCYGVAIAVGTITAVIIKSV